MERLHNLIRIIGTINNSCTVFGSLASYWLGVNATGDLGGNCSERPCKLATFYDVTHENHYNF